jgi:hypothetical protein
MKILKKSGGSIQRDDALMKTYSKKKELPKLADTLHDMFTSEKLTKR